MSTYFKLPCFEPEITKKVLIISNVIIAILGVIHWGYCGVLNQFLRLYYNYTQKPGNLHLLATYDQYKKMLDSPMAYFAITGIQQIITSVLVILIILVILGETKKHIWVRVLTTLILFNFAFNFVIAVSSAMTATYWNQLFKQQLDTLNSLSNGVLDQWITAMVVMLKYITAEAILTFILSLPLILLTAVALVENSFKQDFEMQTQISQEQIQKDNTIGKIQIGPRQ